jgi:hypothetical protein
VKSGFDRSRLEFGSLAGRRSIVDGGMLTGDWDDETGALEFASALPDVLAVRGMRSLASALIGARDAGRARILMYGGHVIKCGLGPLLVRWLRRGVFSCLATNGAGTIHDIEMALFGRTSEDVEAGIADGSFGMWSETTEIYGAAVGRAAAGSTGLGRALGEEVAERGGSPEISPLAASVALDVPLTVHPALGGDIVHPGKAVPWDLLGAAAERDFDRLGECIFGLSGGVVVNAGSAVLLPEVFLKLLTSAVNLGAEIRDITTANLDMIQHYRPTRNVLQRPVAALGGESVAITGHHEFTLPMLDLFVRLEERKRDG